MENHKSFNEKLGYQKQTDNFATKAIHSGYKPEDCKNRPVVPPIITATVFEYIEPGVQNGYHYSRFGNPIRSNLDNSLASLDNAKHALTFSSGVGMTTAIIATLDKGDGIISTHDLYTGTNNLFKEFGRKMDLNVKFIDLTDLKMLESSLKDDTKIVWVESPTNPLMTILDIKSIAKIVHSKSKAILICDNTLSTSYFQRPLELGVDVVTYSLSKYYNGHSDIIMGALTTNDDKLFEKLKHSQTSTGVVPSPFDCYMVLRSLKTLSLRMEKHSENSYLIAKFLSTHPKIEKVFHPSLETHERHQLGCKQSYGHSGVFSFLIKGSLEESKKFLKALKLIYVTGSLGGTESVASIPLLMMVSNKFEKDHVAKGLTDNLIRLSVGLEDLGYRKQNSDFATKSVHAGHKAEEWKGRPVVTPLVTSTTYQHTTPEEHSGYQYSRYKNPTRDVLESCLASLDNAKYGLSFTCGVGVVSAVIATLQSGDEIASMPNMYGGTIRLFKDLAAKMGIETKYIDFSDMKILKSSLTSKTKLVWIETPTNPLLSIVDIKSIADVVHSHSKAIFIVDNTFLTPYFQRPLELGADVAMYSLSKFYNGHSDVTMGGITTNDEKFYNTLKYFQVSTGVVPSPFDCFMANRSIKTLSLRMEKHSENSYAIAKFLESHPKIEKVFHPSLKSHVGHDIALKQSYGHSGIMAFYMKGTVDDLDQFTKALKVIMIAESLGGLETTVAIPWLMSHSDMPEANRLAVGVTPTLVRLNVGVEDIEDLIADLDQALSK
ncbi:CLUMA_CG008646, isoform A [Clunio marinus]|uniref:cystathionine gamma-lyase n=1 Tax=Clunio marinus TaxID=568069 RepID=A0A1J1I532_9DIPT|nr:CLUMA_CG008646, isoform A [Clunio marinus]